MVFVFGFVGRCVATLVVLHIVIMVLSSKQSNSDGPKQIEKPRGTFRYGSPVIATAGQYQGMHGKVEIVYLKNCYVYFPEQGGTDWTMAEVSKNDLRINVPEETMMDMIEMRSNPPGF